MKSRNTTSPPTSKKSRQREQLILALLHQPSLDKAAASIGISTTTAWRISKTDEFIAEYRQARYEAISQSFGRLQQGSSAATSVLLKAMIEPSNPSAVRVQAADRVLRLAKSHLELEDFAERLRRLEELATREVTLDPSPLLA